MATSPGAGGGRRVNPLLIVGLVVVLLAVLFFFVVKPLLFPASETSPAPSPAAPMFVAPKATPTPSVSPTPTAPPETFEVFESKDPFRPLVTAGGPGGTGTGGSTATSTATSGSTPGSTVAPSGAGAAGSSAPAGGTRVSVLDVFTQSGQTKVQVKVGGTVFTVTPGEVFDGTFKLVSVSGSCGTFLHGDDKFTLCKGEEIIK